MKLQKLLAGILTAAMLLGCLILPITVSADGATEISTAEGLQNISKNVAGSYILTSDIDLTDVTWTPIAGFKGTLDGAGHTISHLSGVTALFGSVSSGATIKNLTISDSTFTGTGNDPCGAFAAQATGATFTNLTTTDTVSVKGGWIGGIIGRDNGRCNVSYVVNNASVTASSSYAGGIVGILTAGANNASNYLYCINYGTISNSAGNTYAGGIMGRYNLVNVSYCLNEGEINTSYRAAGLGAMSQDSASTWSNCVNNTTEITGSSGWAFGAFAQASGTVAANNCYWLAGTQNFAIAHPQHGVNVTGTNSVACKTAEETAALAGFVAKIKTAVQNKTTIDGDFTIGDVEGSENNPYKITNAEQLAAINGATKGTFYVLENNIDLGGDEWTPIASFDGVLDGAGYTISNFEITNPDANGNVGLIGKTNVGKIKNLTIDRATINAAAAAAGGVGALVGLVEGEALLSHITIGADVSVADPAAFEVATNYIGGVVGYLKGAATVEYCVNKASVASNGKGTGSIGGVVGLAQVAATITYCANYGEITGGLYEYKNGDGATVSRTQYAGGIVGQMRTATVSYCLNAGEVTAPHIVGGIAAYSYLNNAGTVIGCVNRSTNVIANENYMGSLLGRLDGTVTATNCYAVTTSALPLVAKKTEATQYTFNNVTGGSTEANAAIVSNAAKNLANAIAKGETVLEITEGVKLAAYQKTDVQDGKFNIRFIATLDDYSAYSEVKFKISLPNGSAYYEVPVNTVYTALLETVDGESIYKEAWEMKGNFLAAYAITGIGENDEVDLVITLLAEKNGSTVSVAKRVQITAGVVTFSDYNG